MLRGQAANLAERKQRRETTQKHDGRRRQQESAEKQRGQKESGEIQRAAGEKGTRGAGGGESSESRQINLRRHQHEQGRRDRAADKDEAASQARPEVRAGRGEPEDDVHVVGRPVREAPQVVGKAARQICVSTRDPAPAPGNKIVTARTHTHAHTYREKCEIYTRRHARPRVVKKRE